MFFYPLSFIDNNLLFIIYLFIYCFKTFLNKVFIERPQLATVEKETLFLSLPYLGEISLQTRTKIRKSLKGLLNCGKLEIVLKAKGNSQMFSI